MSAKQEYDQGKGGSPGHQRREGEGEGGKLFCNRLGLNIMSPELLNGESSFDLSNKLRHK